MNALPPPTRPQLDLSFGRRGDRTVFSRRHFTWPFVLTRTFHLDAIPRHLLTVIAQTSSSAVHGEDHLRQRLTLDQGSAVHLTTQGAGVVHRAEPGQMAREAVTLNVGIEAHLEYLPQPRILFPDAALSQTIDLDVAMGGSALLCDAFTSHDPVAAGRGFRRLQSAISVRFGGDEPVVIERLDIAQPALPHARAFATFLLVTRRAVPPTQAQALALSAALADVPGLYGAASLLPSGAGVGIRLAAPELRGVRRGLEIATQACRRMLFDH